MDDVFGIRLNAELVTLTADASLRHLYDDPQKGRGRPRTYDGKVGLRDVSHMKPLGEVVSDSSVLIALSAIGQLKRIPAGFRRANAMSHDNNRQILIVSSGYKKRVRMHTMTKTGIVEIADDLFLVPMLSCGNV